MIYEVVHSDNDFKEAISRECITAICKSALGTVRDIVRISEISGGLYNNTYRVYRENLPTVILRVAPSHKRQGKSDEFFMRNEYAAERFFRDCAVLTPKILYTDFSARVIDRDLMMQSELTGVCAARYLSLYLPHLQHSYYAQLGQITAQIHTVTGTKFGTLRKAHYSSWSENISQNFHDLIADLSSSGCDCTDLNQIMTLIENNTAVLDKIIQPHLLHGDLWSPNIMVAENSPTPIICGVYDYDRASWGDPAFDWPFFMLTRCPKDLQNAFSCAYVASCGNILSTQESHWRALVYAAYHTGAVQLERLRCGKSAKAAASYREIQALCQQLAAFS